MVPRGTNHPDGSLRAITQRLASTPTKQLPHIVPYLASSIADCKDSLAAPDSQRKARDGSVTAVLVHKYKTQLSTLLQDKSIEARWSSVVLIKATIEIGGWEILQGAGPWTRGLLGILAKPDPPTTKKLCVIALTRIFLFTRDYQSLLREITTPSLPSFITSCLNLITSRPSAQEARKPSIYSPLLETVLQSLSELLPRHPSSFRPFVAQIRSLLLPLLAPTPSHIRSKDVNNDLDVPFETPSALSVALARQLYVLLPCCAPKNTSSEEWANALRTLITCIHTTMDHVFRAVLEDYEFSDKPHRNSVDAGTYGEVVSEVGHDGLDLPGWRGIQAGTERLVGLLHLLQTYVALVVPLSVNLPVGAITSATERVLSVIVPGKADQKGFEARTRHNPEIGRDEREGLWSGLIEIHTAAIAVLSSLLSRLGHTSVTIAQGILEQLVWIHQSENGDSDIRLSVYSVISQILGLIGPSMTRHLVSFISPVIRSCCEDLLADNPFYGRSLQSAHGGKVASSNGFDANNADSYLKPTATAVKATEARIDLQTAATKLLPLLLTKIPSAFLPFSLRGQIDRTAVITKHRQAMLASVSNPPTRREQKEISSLMPLLARAYPEVLEVEAIMRPRMPLLQRTREDNGEIESEDDDTANDHRFHSEKPLGQIPSHARGRSMEGLRDILNSEQSISKASEATTHPDQLHDQVLGGISAASIDTPVSQPLLSTETHKRIRETDLEGHITQATSNVGTAASPDLSYAEPSVKRVRLDGDATKTDESMNPSATPTGQVAPFTSTRAPTASASREAAIAPSNLPSGGVSALESDDDDFEIPPIILDSDTDEDAVEEE